MWEQVADWTDRLKVPGGWLYKYQEERQVTNHEGLWKTDYMIAMTFVPDEIHIQGEVI